MIFEKIRAGLLITTAAVLGTAPLAAVWFKQFPVLSPLTNLIVTPIVCFAVLPAGFISGFVALLLDMQVMPFNALMDGATGFALTLVRVFSGIPYSSLHIHNPPILLIVLYYMSLVFLLRSRKKWRSVPFLIVICVYILIPYLYAGDFRVTFLDVGQGDSSFIELPDGRTMLVDGGMDSPDMGRLVIAPWLWSRGIKKIDYLVMSHPHPDHYGGLYYIMDNFDVGELWLNGRMKGGARECVRRGRKRAGLLRSLKRGDIIEGGNYAVYVLHPYDGYNAGSPRGAFSDENNATLVLKIETDNASVLFTGDIEEEAEMDLVHLGAWLKSDILKVPHHGGRTSSSVEFIRTVSPLAAVVSSGRHNPFNHPHAESVERYRAAGTLLFRTDRDGAVTITPADGSLNIETYEDGRLRKASGWKDELHNLRLLL